MAGLITDLDAIARMAKLAEDENLDFRTFIKGLDWSDRRLDACVHELLAEVESEIDCTQCGNCCRSMYPSLTKGDIRRLAKRLGITEQEFDARYVVDERRFGKCMRDTPCSFLSGCVCTVYEDRPADCRAYPHIQKKDFRGRMFGVLENAGVCPIVFNVLERLKERFPRRRYRW